MSNTRIILIGLVGCVICPFAEGRELVWTTAFSGISLHDSNSGVTRPLPGTDGISFGSSADATSEGILFAGQRKLLRFDLASSTTSVLLDGGPISTEETIAAPLGLAVDERDGKVYWAEGLYNRSASPPTDARSLRSFDPNTGDVSVIYKFDGYTPRSVFVDPTEDVVYVGAGTTHMDPQSSASGAIFRISFDGTDVQKIYDTNLNNVFGMGIDHENGRLFWGERSVHRQSYIMSGSLDGSTTPESIMHITDTNLEDLFYHPLEERIYYATGGRIASVAPDGSQPEALVSANALLSFALLDRDLAYGRAVPETVPNASIVASMCFLCWARKRRGWQIVS